MVFGGPGGLGRASAGLMAERGANAVVTYRSRAANAEAILAELRKLGRQASAIVCNIMDRTAVEAVFKHAVDTNQRMHTVLSAASHLYETGPLA